MKKVLKDNRGVALVLVILIITIVIAVSLQFNLDARSVIYEAANLRDGIKLMYVAKSGFNAAEALLREDSTDVDSLIEDWAALEEISAVSAGFFNGESFKITIEDEKGKIPINKLVNGDEYNIDIKELFLRFLTAEQFDLSEEEALDIADAIKDWIDEDNEETRFGAETAYYKSLESPFSCKNAPLDSIDELLMVKGITEELLYGTLEKPGIAPYLTVYGEDKININTAPLLVIKVLANEISNDVVAEIDQFRRNHDNDLSSLGWYRDIPGMSTIEMNENIIMTKSNFFKIESTGFLGTMHKKVTGIIERDIEKQKIKLLSWKVR